MEKEIKTTVHLKRGFFEKMKRTCNEHDCCIVDFVGNACSLLIEEYDNGGYLHDSRFDKRPEDGALVGIRLDAWMRRDLKGIALKNKCSMASIIREGLAAMAELVEDGLMDPSTGRAPEMEISVE